MEHNANARSLNEKVVNFRDGSFKMELGNFLVDRLYGSAFFKYKRQSALDTAQSLVAHQLPRPSCPYPSTGLNFSA
jgi:hypothetical protein